MILVLHYYLHNGFSVCILLAIIGILISLQKIKKKMESTRDQLAEALYQKGLALAEIESLKVRALMLFKAMIVHYQ